MKVVYSDLDGTMVGPRGCFFRAADRSTTLDPSRALVDLHDAGIALVLVSGRTRPQLFEAAAIFGADGFVAEMGALVGWKGGMATAVLPSAAPPGQIGVPADALAEFLADFAGRVELYTPWADGHEVDVLLRGNLPPINDWLQQRGLDWLELVDNGVLPPGAANTLRLPPPAKVHVYHLLPKGISKEAAIAWDLARRGLTAADAIAIGDSRADLGMAATVTRMFVTANGAAHVQDLLPSVPNAVVCDGPLGAGWTQAVRWALGN